MSGQNGDEGSGNARHSEHEDDGVARAWSAEADGGAQAATPAMRAPSCDSKLYLIFAKIFFWFFTIMAKVP